MLKVPENKQYVLFGGSFVLANKLQWVADKRVGGLTSKQWFLLKTLKDMPSEPKVTITALAKETDTSRQNVAKMLGHSDTKMTLHYAKVLDSSIMHDMKRAQQFQTLVSSGAESLHPPSIILKAVLTIVFPKRPLVIVAVILP